MIFKASGSFFHVKLFMPFSKGMEIPFTMLSKKFAPSGALCCRWGGCLGADVIPAGFGGFEGLPFKLGG